MASSEISRGWALLASAGAGVFCSVIVLPYHAIGPLVVPITTELGWTRAEFQAAIGFSAGLGALTAPAVGWLCDRFGARALAIPGLVGLSCGFLMAAAMNGELWMLYLAYGAMALLGAGTIPVTWTRAITTNFFKQRGLALGLALSSTGICAAVVPQYVTWLAQTYGWREAYVGLALLPLLFALPFVVWGFRPREDVAQSAEATAANAEGLTLAQAVRGSRFWILLASIFVSYMAFSGIGPNMIPALTDGGMTPANAASVMSAFGIAIIIGRIVVGYLVDRFWAPGVAFFALCMPVVGCLIMLSAPGWFSASVAAALIGFAAGAELDLMSFLAARYFGLAHYAKIYSILYMSLAVCSGTAPMLFARVYDVTASYDVSFYVASGLFVAGAVLVLFLGRYPEHFGSSRA
ncbi:MAG: MFS transporter [Pseudomonadales bacterium]